MGDDQADLPLAPSREALPGHLYGFAQRHLLCLIHFQPLKEGEDPLVKAPALRELVAPATRQVVQSLAVLQLLADFHTAKLSKTVGSWRKSVFVLPQSFDDLLGHVSLPRSRKAHRLSPSRQWPTRSSTRPATVAGEWGGVGWAGLGSDPPACPPLR